jgi:hypothetical protein
MRGSTSVSAQLDRLSTWEEFLSATSDTPEPRVDLFWNNGSAVLTRTEEGELPEISESDLALLLGFNQLNDELLN